MAKLAAGAAGERPAAPDTGERLRERPVLLRNSGHSPNSRSE